MKYCVFSKWAWIYLLWTQACVIFVVLTLRFNPLALQGWLFITACLVQPVFALLCLLFGRKRKGIVQYTRVGDTWHWRLV